MWKYERRKKKWIDDEVYDVYTLKIGDYFNHIVCLIIQNVLTEHCTFSTIRIVFHPNFPEAQQIPCQDKPQNIEEAMQTVKKILLAYKNRIDNLSKEIEQFYGT